MSWIEQARLCLVAGTIDRYILNPQAVADGMLLSDGTGLQFPPHFGILLTDAIAPGDPIEALGLPSAPSVFSTTRVRRPGAASWIVDPGPDGRQHSDDHADRLELQLEGVVQRALYSHKGDLHGAIVTDDLFLRDGVVVRVPRQAAADPGIAALLQAGARIAVRGFGVRTRHGAFVDAEAIGAERHRLMVL